MEKFASPDFDAAVYVQGVDDPEKALADLGEKLKLVDEELKEETRKLYPQLFLQLDSLSEIRKTHAATLSQIKALKEAVVTMRSETDGPARTLRQLTNSYVTTHQTLELTRRVARFFRLLARLKKTPPPPPASDGQPQSQGPMLGQDLARDAQTLRDIDDLVSENPEALSQVSAVQLLEAVKARRLAVGAEATGLLFQSFQSMNQSSMATCVLTFTVLGELKPKLDNLAGHALNQARDAFRAAFDPRLYVRPAHKGVQPSGVESPQWRQELWERVAAAQEAVSQVCIKVGLSLGLVGPMLTMEAVLARRRDQGAFPGQPGVADGAYFVGFWGQLAEGFKADLQTACTGSPFLQGILTDEFPRLLVALEAIQTRVRDAMGLLNGSASAGWTGLVLGQLAQAVRPLRDQYVVRSQQRLFAWVEALFAGGRVPGWRESTTFVSQMHAEMDAVLDGREWAPALRPVLTSPPFHPPPLQAQQSEDLVRAVGRNFSKALELFVSKCEDARRGGHGPAATAHTHNAALAGALHSVGEAMADLLGCPRGSGAAPQQPGAPVAALPLPEAHTSLLRQCVTVQPLYSLSSRIAEYTRRYVLYYYSKHADFGARCAELTGRVLRHFCTLACLVRPLGEGGKLHLADDIARVEYAMQPLSKPADQVGSAPLRAMRALKSLLFLEITEFRSHGDLVAALSPLLVAHHLCARVPEAVLPSPHGFLPAAAGTAQPLTRTGSGVRQQGSPNQASSPVGQYAEWLQAHQGPEAWGPLGQALVLARQRGSLAPAGAGDVLAFMAELAQRHQAASAPVMR
ncbi:putative Conserved oligomeric Golgi complex subunit 5 [Paratrimastix pyriformis]|uniref:Conserved oligomeric Golgi complex subunit 5 n=1 Tax=Paratrimastix pyriformis TaxID=342808 RepID=A0ABQ8UU06_9EUKA|nr:putative Conserved oligomeric Golgi complex subunit 5 [Paratrimastix pyriformis]